MVGRDSKDGRQEGPRRAEYGRPKRIRERESKPRRQEGRCGHDVRSRKEEAMKGHIRERSPGRFAIVLDVRDPSTGKRKRKWHSFRGTKRQAQIECAGLVSAIDVG